jgi:hypothetical protein
MFYFALVSDSEVRKRLPHSPARTSEATGHQATAMIAYDFFGFEVPMRVCGLMIGTAG